MTLYTATYYLSWLLLELTKLKMEGILKRWVEFLKKITSSNHSVPLLGHAVEAERTTTRDPWAVTHTHTLTHKQVCLSLWLDVSLAPVSAPADLLI